MVKVQLARALLDTQTVSSNFNTSQAVLNAVVCFVLMLFIYYIYKKSYTEVLYSKNMNITLMVVGLVTCFVVMVIANNIALALGMVGALSIVRFRSAIKDPLDIAFIFWSITIGILTGVSAYGLAFVATLFIGIVIIILTKKIQISKPYLVVMEGSEFKEMTINSVLRRYCSNFKTRSTVLSSDKNDLTIEVRVKSKLKVQGLVEELKELKGITKVMLISYDGEIVN